MLSIFWSGSNFFFHKALACFWQTLNFWQNIKSLILLFSFRYHRLGYGFGLAVAWRRPFLRRGVVDVGGQQTRWRNNVAAQKWDAPHSSLLLSFTVSHLIVSSSVHNPLFVIWARWTPRWGGSLGRWGSASTSAVWDCHLKKAFRVKNPSRQTTPKKRERPIESMSNVSPTLEKRWQTKEWKNCFKIVPHHAQPPPAPAQIQNTDLAPARVTASTHPTPSKSSRSKGFK